MYKIVSPMFSCIEISGIYAFDAYVRACKKVRYYNGATAYLYENGVLISHYAYQRINPYTCR